MFEYKVKKQLGNPCSVNGLMARCKNYPLRKAMIDHDHDRIKPCGRREIGDEVNRELLKGESDIGLDGKERRYNGVRVSLVLLTNGAPSDEVLHEGGKALATRNPVPGWPWYERPPYALRKGRSGWSGVKQSEWREVRVNRGEPLSRAVSALSTKGSEAEEDLMWQAKVRLRELMTMGSGRMGVSTLSPVVSR